MRGEHCVLGASILSGIAVILLIFANIGQISSGGLTKSIYLAQVDVIAYGNALATATNSTPGGLYQTNNTILGKSSGIRQYYRYGLYNACGYQKDSSGICNSTIFGYPMEPLTQIEADTPSKYKIQWNDIIPDSSFKDNGMNHSMSRAGSLLIFIGSILVLVGLIFGLVRSRFFFLVAAASSGLAALFLMIGAALWTALVSKDAWLSRVKVKGGAKLGIYVSTGPSVYLVWVSFGLVVLSVLPYVVACCTFRRN